jgi:hypothetical protein
VVPESMTFPIKCLNRHRHAETDERIGIHR